MRKRRLAVLGMCAIAGLTACGKADGVVKPDVPVTEVIQDEPSGEVVDNSNVVTDTNVSTGDNEIDTGVIAMDKHQRAFEMAARIFAENQTNMMFSPTSLNLALGLVEEGSSGVTEAELNKFLCEKDFSERAVELMQFAEDRTMESTEEWNSYKTVLNIANSVWLNDTYTINEDYKTNVESKYKATIESVSFKEDALKDTTDKINNWCNDNTEEMIPTIVTEDLLKNDPASVLVNTVYFEAPWVDEWNETAALDRFIADDGTVYNTDFMVNYGDNIYYETDNFKAFSARYRNGLKFIGIMPIENKMFNLADINLTEILDREKEGRYELQTRMPKLNFSTDITNIVDIMKAMGVSTAFDASTSTIDGMVEHINGDALYIGNIIQKTKLELDEKGTKAAAATAVIMMENSAFIEEKIEVIEMDLDRPFAFVIYDEEVDEILFVGKVVDFK